MSKTVIVYEDDQDLADLVRELLSDAGFIVTITDSIEALLREATLRSPCVALVDSTDPSSFDLWWLGPRLQQLGVPPVAFTAHSSAQQEFAADPHGYVGVVSKPFDTNAFVDLISQICWEEHHQAAS